MKTSFASALLLVAATGAAYAQQTPDTVQLDTFVVTATRVPTALSKVTASITVIDGAQLRRAGMRTVEEALRTVSGAAVVQSGSYGGGTSLFLRGGESDYVQVLVDGVQVNSPGEAFNWSTLSIEDVERIEVVKGPASVLYGSDAVAGVVQIITRRGRGKPRGDLALLVGRGDKVGSQANGSFDNGYLRGEVAGGTGKVGYSVGVSHFATEGAYAFNNEHRNTSVTGHTGFELGAATLLSATARVDKSRFHYPTDGSGTLNDRNQFNDGSMISVGLDATHRFTSAIDALLSLQHSENEDISDDRSDNAADTIGFYRFYSEQQFRRQNADLRVNFKAGASSLLTLGAEVEQQKNTGSSTSPFGDTPETTVSRSDRAAYAQLLQDMGALSLQLGVRGEDNDKFGNFVTYRGGVAAKVAPNVKLRASAGTAFKQPRFFEQFAQGFVVGNPALSPEKSRSIEVGGDVAFSRVSIGATYFDQRFRDLIQYIGVTAKPTDPNYVNVAGAKASGAEFSIGTGISDWQINAQYTLLSTKVTDDGDGSDASFTQDEELIRRPKHSASLALSRSIGRTDLSVIANYVGERTDLDFSTYPSARVTLPSYTRVDIASRQRLNSAVALSVKVENALNEKYSEVLGFPAHERVVFIGAQVGF